MTELVELWERPQSEELYMIVGWRQWADAGSVSSGLPEYLVEQHKAEKIGRINGDDFYLFQIPGTHDLVRPMIEFDQGYPESLQTHQNEFYYTGDAQRGVVIFIGDEPHLGIERYTRALLDTAQSLGVKRIVSLGGVYGELPYDKARMVGGIYSLPRLRDEVNGLAVNLSDYQGGASIGSYVCKRAEDYDIEFVGLYAFVPTYDFSTIEQRGSAVRIENDYTAWLGVMKRINHMFKTRFSLTDLEQKSENLVAAVESRLDELSQLTDIDVRAYIETLSENFEEVVFDPLGDVWEEELRRLFDEESGEGDGD